MRFPVFDLHSDLILRVADNGVDLASDAPWPQTTLSRLRAGGVTRQVYAIWLDDHVHSGPAATERANHLIDVFEAQMARHAGEIALARTVTEAEAINTSGRVAAFLWLEGGGALNGDLALLSHFRARGVAGVTLCWNHSLPWAGSSGDGTRRGLSGFGREAVREMNRLGLVVDLSHGSDEAFWDALNASSDPIMFTHSGCRALCDRPRNVSDEMLRALAARGGLMGIISLADFLNPAREAGWEALVRAHAGEIEALAHGRGAKDPTFRHERSRFLTDRLPPEARVTLDLYLDHIEHVMGVAGERHVALGSDFDGSWAWPTGLENASCWPAVTEGLLRRGHSEETVHRIAHGNAERLFGSILGRIPANPGGGLRVQGA